MPHLIRPTTSLQKSQLEALLEYRAEGRYLQYEPFKLQQDYPGYIEELLAQEKLASQMLVPMTIFWLVEGEEFIGRVSIRHYINEWLLRVGGHIGYDIRPTKRRLGYGTMILRLALPKAKELGIERVLVTCDEDNVGSARIIEKNGGILEDIIEVEGLPKRKRRYWIDNG
jgi:predicted acetyltransferase